MRAWLSKDELRQVLEDVLAMREKLNEKNSKSCCGIWRIFCWNPMRFFRAADKDLLLEALLDVYDGVPRPIVDADDDGLDDNTQVRAVGLVKGRVVWSNIIMQGMVVVIHYTVKRSSQGWDGAGAVQIIPCEGAACIRYRASISCEGGRCCAFGTA